MYCFWKEETSDEEPTRAALKAAALTRIVLAFWDGKSRGTKFVIDNCRRLGVEVRVYIMD